MSQGTLYAQVRTLLKRCKPLRYVTRKLGLRRKKSKSKLELSQDEIREYMIRTMRRDVKREVRRELAAAGGNAQQALAQFAQRYKVNMLPTTLKNSKPLLGTFTWVE